MVISLFGHFDADSNASPSWFSVVVRTEPRLDLRLGQGQLSQCAPNVF